MTPEFYERVCRICYDALQREAPRRSSFLDRACDGDAALRIEVEAMLACEGRVESFLATPALIVAANQLAEVSDVEVAILQSADQNANDAYPIRSETFTESFAPGTALGGRYLIDKELSRGGVCAVFLARDQKLHYAPVVIKVLLKIWQQTGHKTWMEKKFKGEIAALARIDHPGVVRALDVGEAPDGRSYLVMQYVSGESLRSVMTQEGMELDRMAKLVRQMGRALAAAHRQGVIHRDLKPENIMLQSVGDEEYVKLIDFGIATIYEIADAADSRTTEVVGTRSYMAPEQLRGKPLVASDIYALGVIVYEMATGQRPFNSESILQLYELQRAGAKVKPCDLRPDFPEAAQSIILKALSFSPQDRYTDAKEFTDALADRLTGKGGPALLQSRMFAVPKRWLLILVSIIVAVIGILAFPRFDSPQVTNHEQLQTAPIMDSDRRLSYSMEARRDPRRYHNAKPFATFDNVIFGAGDELRLYISSPQSGSLYVINEGPMTADGLPNFNVLFPDMESGDSSPEIGAGIPVRIPLPSGNPLQDWLVFDHEEGVEYIWLVWSERVVPELEAVKGSVSPKDHCAIRDSTQRASVSHFLAQFSDTRLEIERDDESKQTRLKGKGSMLVWKMKLAHH